MSKVIDIEDVKRVYCVSALYQGDFITVVENVSKSEAITICNKYELENKNHPRFVDCFVGKKIL